MEKILRLKFIGINENNTANLKLVRITGENQEEVISLKSFESGVAIYEISGLADKEEFKYKFTAPRIKNGKIQEKVIFDYDVANPVLEISANISYPEYEKGIDFVLDFSNNQGKIGDYSQYRCELTVVRDGTRFNDYGTENVKVKDNKVIWKALNFESGDDVSVNIIAYNNYFKTIVDSFKIDDSTTVIRTYKPEIIEQILIKFKFKGLKQGNPIGLELKTITQSNQETTWGLRDFINGIATYEIPWLKENGSCHYIFTAPGIEGGKIEDSVVFKDEKEMKITKEVHYPVIKKNIDVVLDFVDNQGVIGDYNQYECNLKVTRDDVEVKNFTTDNVRIKNTENGKVTWEVTNLEVDDYVKVDITARNGYFHPINDEFGIEESTPNIKTYKPILKNEPKPGGDPENGIVEITVNAPKQRKLTELTNLEFKAQIKRGGVTNNALLDQVNKINESETSITWQISHLKVLDTVIYEIKSLDSEGHNEIAPVSDSAVYKTKVTKSRVLTFLKEKKPENPQETQKPEKKEPKYEGLDDFSGEDLKVIKEVMTKNSCFDHLRASRHFFPEGVEKSPENAVITKESLKAFLKEFKYYLFSRDDIKLYKLLKSKLNN